MLRVNIKQAVSVIAFAFLLLLGGCSTQSLNNNDKGSNAKGGNVSDYYRKQLALDRFIDGCAAEAKGDYQSATALFESASAIDPDAAGIKYELAKCNYFTNNLANAVKYAKTAVALDSTNIDYLDLLQEIFSNAKLDDSAIVVLNKMLEKDSTRIDTYYNLARLSEKNKPLYAISVYKKLLSITGNDFTILVRMSELYEKVNKIDEAIKSVRELSALDPENPGLKKILSELLVRNKKYDEAFAVLNDILVSYPFDIETRQRKAETYLIQEKWKEAANEFLEIISYKDVRHEAKVRVAAEIFVHSFKDTTLFPIAKQFFETIAKDSIDWQVKMHLGAIAMRENKDSLAIAYFNEVTENSPWNLEAWIRLGALYYDSREPKEAIIVLNRAKEIFPEEFPINLILGLAHSQVNQFDSAVVYYKKAYRLNRTDLTVLTGYGYALNKVGDVDGAVTMFNQALTISPDNVDIYGTLGLILENNGRTTESDSIYNVALKLDPDNALVNNNYAYSLSKRKLRLPDAVKMIDRALEMVPGSASYLDTKGWILFMMEQYEEAVVYIKKSLDADGNNSEVEEHLGDALYKLGRVEEAKKAWQRGLDLNKGSKELKIKLEKGLE